MAERSIPHAPPGATGVLLLESGEALFGHGFGAEGSAAGELCFHTAMTGYQEILTDPSFARQIITFTFPHIGNVGANREDVERERAHAIGCVTRELPTRPSSFRHDQPLADWMARERLIGLAGVDTRALTRRIRVGGAPNAVIAHDAEGRFDWDSLSHQLADFPGMEGLDLASEVAGGHRRWTAGGWRLGTGYDEAGQADGARRRPHVVAVDYGSKHMIFRTLVAAGAELSIVPARATFEEIMALRPDGVFLSNGPGDPAATADYALPVIQRLLAAEVPIFGICLGHQLLALALGGRTTKMFQGHRGANHPVKRLADGPDGHKVEITSMNHGFAVERASLPDGVRETHLSLFDGSNAGLETANGRVFSVQYHPEASPGPQDSRYLFERFVGRLR